MENVYERLEALEEALRVMQMEKRTLGRRLVCWRLVGSGLIALGLLLSIPHPGQAFEDTKTIERLTALEALLMHFLRSGNNVYITGANVHIRSGMGVTNGYREDPTSANPFFTHTNGLGNLIIGYNEASGEAGDNRDGSHNLVIGSYHDYGSFGGLVAGQFNQVTQAYASVSGGRGNKASGAWSSVSGGRESTASGSSSSVSGGYKNAASDTYSSVSGGIGNAATAYCSSVTGGSDNTASGSYSAVSGGSFNRATYTESSVSGGDQNTANGFMSWVGGGWRNTAAGDRSTVSGGANNAATGFGASVSGGSNNLATNTAASVSGGTYLVQGTQYGWSAGTLGPSNFTGRFRSP